MQVGVFVITQQ